MSCLRVEEEEALARDPVDVKQHEHVAGSVEQSRDRTCYEPWVIEELDELERANVHRVAADTKTRVPDDDRHPLADRGFAVGEHDVAHEGNLAHSTKETVSKHRERESSSSSLGTLKRTRKPMSTQSRGPMISKRNPKSAFARLKHRKLVEKIYCSHTSWSAHVTPLISSLAPHNSLH